ncbi:nephrin-like, partial [Pseudopipra pipra]|uniref:nephrin-like n=1 Tax=Pseudopipra pipra TaxID=415032 RepID=UPI00313A2D2B
LTPGALPVPPSAPSIEGLESPQVRAGQTLKLVCVARGGNPPPSLHWDKDGRPLAGAWSRDSAHVTRNRLVLGVTPEDDGATLRCRAVTSLPGGGGSASVQLEVTYPPSEVTLSGSGTVPLNGSATLGCTSAPSNPPVRLRWWLGGRQLEPSGGGPTPGWGRGLGAVSNVTLWGRVEDHGENLVCEAETPGVGTRSASVTISVPRESYWVILVYTGLYWFVLG